jgi:hypothetical protein
MKEYEKKLGQQHKLGQVVKHSFSWFGWRLAVSALGQFLNRYQRLAAVILAIAFGTVAFYPTIAAAEIREISWENEVKQQAKELLVKLFDESDKIPTTGLPQIDEKTKEFKDKAKIARAMAEHFGWIDPREASVQPDYSPADMPLLPTRCEMGSSAQCGRCYTGAQEDLNKWRRLLEDQFVIYKKTMFEVERLTTLGEAAGSMSGLARLVWNLHTPELAAKAQFFAAYDSNYEKLMQRVNNSLANLAECERKHFNDYGWYFRYGLPFYLYIRDRYRRPK